MNIVLDVAFSADRTRVMLLSENAPLYKYDCPRVRPRRRWSPPVTRRVSTSVKRNAVTLSLQ